MIQLLQDLGIAKMAEKLDTIDVKQNFAQQLEHIKETDPQTLMHELLSSALDFGLKLIAAFAIYAVGMWVIRRIKKTVMSTMQRRGRDKAIVSFVQSLLSVLLTLMLIIMVISTLGINTTSLAAILAASGMAIGMALSGAMSNFAGGMLILIFKPFKAGDYIETNGFGGTVHSISIFSTEIHTPDNKTIYIPNGTLSNAPINNFTSCAFRRVEWQIDTAYGTEVEHMREVALSLVEEEKLIQHISDGAPDNPSCNILSLKDSSVLFTIRAWVKAEDYWSVYFNLNNSLYTNLPKAGIQFPFPQMDVHIHKEN